MAPRPSPVSVDLALRLMVADGTPLPVRSTLHFDPADPYAVQIAFFTGKPDAEVVEWTFARQLLTDGVSARAGQGDVQVWPSASAEQVCLSLSSPSGSALFELPVHPVVEFLAQTYAVVPTGCESEYVDVDAELALLLWAEPGT